MPYFAVMNGLRGCYMPDSVSIIRASTRRELKAALEWEARDIRDAGGIGLSKRAVAWLAAAAWKARKAAGGEYVAPYRWAYQSPGSFPFALFCSPSTRADYIAQESGE